LELNTAGSISSRRSTRYTVVPRSLTAEQANSQHTCMCRVSTRAPFRASRVFSKQHTEPPYQARCRVVQSSSRRRCGHRLRCCRWEGACHITQAATKLRQRMKLQLLIPTVLSHTRLGAAHDSPTETHRHADTYAHDRTLRTTHHRCPDSQAGPHCRLTYL
jgi:hypothetical protein